MKEGYINPSVQANGRGSKAVFPKRDVYVVAIFESMMNRGIKRSVASELIHRLLKEDRQLAQSYMAIRYGEKDDEVQINAFSAKAIGADLVTGAFYRPVHQYDNYLQADKTGRDMPFMPFNQRSQTSVFNPAEKWDCTSILNIAGIKERVDASISRS